MFINLLVGSPSAVRAVAPVCALVEREPAVDAIPQNV